MAIFSHTVIFLALVVQNDAARILAMFPVPSISHQVIFREITHALAKRGHDLVIITPDPAFEPNQAPKNIVEINVRNKSYEAWRESVQKTAVNPKITFYEILRASYTSIIDICDLQMLHEEVQKVFKSEKKFDLLLAEASAKPVFALAHIFNIPAIAMSSSGSYLNLYTTHGAAFHPVIYPESARRKIYNLTIWEKLESVYEDVKYRYMTFSLRSHENDIVRRHFGSGVPSVNSLLNKADMLFLNINPLFEGNRPLPPGILHLGRLHIKPVLGFPDDYADIKSFLDKSQKGVIYMSLGTNILSSLWAPKTFQLFFNVFSKLPYDVLIKWDTDNYPNIAENIKFCKWLPQPHVLAHPNIKIFITQGGLQSTDEAITAGVPMIALPFSSDQFYNAEKYVYFGIGIKLDRSTLTENILEQAIWDIINNQKYSSNIIKLHSLLEDQPVTPLHKAVWWTEKVLKHGGALYWRTPSRDLSWIEIVMIDLMLIVIMFLLILYFSIKKLAIFVKKMICENNVHPNEKFIHLRK